MTEYPDTLPSMATMLREQKEEIERLRVERDALAEKLDRAVLSEKPTDAQVDDACMSYNHSFGLMGAQQADQLRWQAREWWRCIARAT